MAILSKKEFAESCGMTTRELAVYIKRGKLLVKDDETIDDTVLENIDFRSRHKDKKQRATGPKPAPDKKQKPSPARIKHEAEKTTTLYELDKETKTLEVEKRKKDSEILGIKISKMRGEVIPTDLVRLLFSQHFKSVTITFKQGIENLLSEIQRKTKMNLNEMAELRGVMVKIINESVNQSVNESSKHVDNLVDEYRKIGERV